MNANKKLSINIKHGDVIIPYALESYGDFIVDKVFKNRDGGGYHTMVNLKIATRSENLY